MRYSRPLTALGLLALCAAALAYTVHEPPVASASAPQSAFSADRAFAHVAAIAQRPHPLGSVEHNRVREYVMTQITALGLLPQVQEATGVGTRYPVAGRIRNIVVRMPGTQPRGKAVLLMAHYDGVPAGPAAGDDGSGTAVLLETLRALKATGPLLNDVIALFTDGEEAGLLGAAAFARQHPWAKDVAIVLNFEARGTHGPSLMFETGAGNMDVVRMLRRVGGGRATSLSTTVYRKLPNDTDLSETAVLQQPAMNFAFIGGVQRYHTAEDDVAHLSRGSVQHHGNQALALAVAFGSQSLPRPPTSDAVFFDLPLLGVLVYPQALALPFAVLVLLLAVGSVVALRGREPRWLKDSMIGLAGVVLSMVIAAAVGAGTISAVSRLHAALTSGGDPRWSAVYASAIALLSVATVLLVFGISRRIAGARGITGGALLALAVLNVALSATLPGVSFLLTWPLFFTSLALVVAVTGMQARFAQARGWLAAAVVIFLLVPTIFLMVVVALGLDTVGAVLLALLSSVTAWLLIPQLEFVAGTGWWRPALFTAGAAMLLLVLGAATVRSDGKHPAGAALVYAIDSDSLAAWLTGSATTASARRIMRESLVSSPDGSDTKAPEWLTRRFDPRRVVRAPMAALEPPTATLLSDSTRADGRVVTLRILGGRGAREVSVVAAEGAVEGAWVDGLYVDRSRYRSRPQRWALEYIAPTDSGVTLRLSLPRGGSATLALTSRHDGIPTIPGLQVPVLPHGVIPIQDGHTTLVYKRVRL